MPVERAELDAGIDRVVAEMTRGFQMLNQRADTQDETLREIDRTVNKHAGQLQLITANRRRVVDALGEDREDRPAKDPSQRKVTWLHVSLVLGTVIAVIAVLKFFGKV